MGRVSTLLALSFRLAIALASMGLALAGCETRVSLGASCRDSAECGEGVCGVGGRCRAECVRSDDCAAGARCLRDPATGLRGCSLALDTCSAGSCADGLRCVEGQCLGVCIQSIDCPDGLCVDDACVVPTTVDGGVADAPSLDAPVSSCPEGGTLSVDVGRWSVCAIRCDRQVYCWGHWGPALLGTEAPAMCDGTPCFEAPHAIDLPPQRWAEVAVGDTRVCARSEAGEVWCWGLLVETPLSAPARIVQEGGVALVASELVAGGSHHCARDAGDGSLRCWGWNAAGQLGDGTMLHSAPAVVAFEGVESAGVFAGEWRTHVVDVEGRVHGAGQNDDGEIVWPSSESTPAGSRSDLPAPARDLAVTDNATCALLDEGRIVCWGRTAVLFGRSDPSSAMDCPPNLCVPTPFELARGRIPPGPLEGIEGDRFAPYLLAWNAAGQLYGVGGSDQQVLGTDPYVYEAVQLVALMGARTHFVRAGAETACAILDGTRELVCWGQNHVGQLGRGGHGPAQGMALAPAWP
ncbi:MAG: hypothetical protein U0353_15420 [Sandaracinus sp.]